MGSGPTSPEPRRSGTPVPPRARRGDGGARVASRRLPSLLAFIPSTFLPSTFLPVLPVLLLVLSALMIVAAPAAARHGEDRHPRSGPGAAAVGAAELNQADQLALTGRTAEALTLYRQVGEAGSSPEVRATGWLRAGRLAGEGSESENDFRRAAQLAQTGEVAAESRLELGKLYYAQGAYRAADQALAGAQKQLHKGPFASELLLFRARAAMALRDYDDAATAYRELSHDRTQAQCALTGWGQALLESGQPARAASAFERAAEDYPGGDCLSGALAGLALACERSRKPDRATAARARLGLVAAASFDAQDLPASPGSAAPGAAASATTPAARKTAATTPAARKMAVITPAARKSAATTRAMQAAPHEPPTHVPSTREPAAHEPAIRGASKHEPTPHEPPASSRPATTSLPEGQPQRFYLQLGLFSQRANALALLRRASDLGFAVRIDSIARDLGPIYQVRGPGFETREDAQRAAERFRSAGLVIQIKPGSPSRGR